MSDKIDPKTLNLLKLWLIEGLGPKSIASLLERFPDPQQIFDLDTYYLKENFNVPSRISHLIQTAKSTQTLEEELKVAKKHQVNIIGILEESYPKLLAEISNPPPILYYRGCLNFLDKAFPLAIVGSRKPSYYGKKHTDRFISEIKEYNPETIIISGLAYGIDTQAHTTALKEGLKTIAVMAGGLSNVYPRENYSLSEKIIEQGGALVTEFPILSKPAASNFPLRNRIISGLSLGTLVMEGSEKSGALITANYALEQNRELFALPGSIENINSAGPHSLIKKSKAKLVSTVQDIFDEFQFNHSPSSPIPLPHQAFPAISQEEQKILELFQDDITWSANAIAQHTNTGIGRLLGILTTLEAKGVLISLIGDEYRKA